MDQILIELPTLTKNANTVKKAVLNKLLDDKVITKQQHEYYNVNMQVIAIKYGWFKNWFDKFFAKDNQPEDYSYRYVDLGKE